MFAKLAMKKTAGFSTSMEANAFNLATLVNIQTLPLILTNAQPALLAVFNALALD